MTNSNYNFVPLAGYENYEATTQIVIAEILKRNLPLEIIDSSNNLIATKYNGKEYIIHEGTISDANSIIAFWISNDKWMTKLFLKRNNINHAKGVILHKNYEDSAFAQLKFPLVAKPFNTDHGIAVSTNITNKDDLYDSIKLAQEYSKKVIIEEYFDGREYRFLVIDYKVRAIAYRVPANVVGNGKSTILELIDKKNEGRGDDYKSPLLKIKLDSEIKRHLKEQNLNLDSILKEGEQVFLRKNSNLSTGGDSIDVTDDVPKAYKEIAQEAAKSAGLKIAGVDIIIKDLDEHPNNKNHIVVELNAPAMLSMHDYPFIGKNRNVAKYVLDVILGIKSSD